jgi:hypothetical protein
VSFDLQRAHSIIQLLTFPHPKSLLIRCAVHYFFVRCSVRQDRQRDREGDEAGQCARVSDAIRRHRHCIARIFDYRGRRQGEQEVAFKDGGQSVQCADAEAQKNDERDGGRHQEIRISKSHIKQHKRPLFAILTLLFYFRLFYSFAITKNQNDALREGDYGVYEGSGEATSSKKKGAHDDDDDFNDEDVGDAKNDDSDMDADDKPKPAAKPKAKSKFFGSDSDDDDDKAGANDQDDDDDFEADAKVQQKESRKNRWLLSNDDTTTTASKDAKVR